MDQKDIFRNYDVKTPEFTLNGIKTYARVVSIYDADTVKLVIPVLGSYYKFNVRLLGIDTCEIKAKDAKNKDLALKARGRLFELVTGIPLNPVWKKKEIENYLSNDIFIVWVECEDYDKWGRVLAHLYQSTIDPERKSFSQSLLEEKLAYPYEGGTKLSEEQQLTYYL